MFSRASIDKSYSFGKWHVLGAYGLVFSLEAFCQNLEVSQPVQHAYSFANPPREEQTHLCLCVYVCVYVGVCLCQCPSVFFLNLQIKFIPYRFFFLSMQSDNKHATTQHTAKPRVTRLSALSAEGVDHKFRNAPKDKTLSSKIPFNKSLQDMDGYLHIFLQFFIHTPTVHTPWQNRDVNIISPFLSVSFSRSC